MDAAEAFCVWLLVLRRWLRNKKCEIKKRQYEARGRDDPTRRRAPREESRKVAITRKWESAQNKSARRSQRKLLGSIEERWIGDLQGRGAFLQSVLGWPRSLVLVFRAVHGAWGSVHIWLCGRAWHVVVGTGRSVEPAGPGGRYFTISR